MSTLREFTEAIIFIDRKIKPGAKVIIKDRFAGTYPIKKQVMGTVRRVYKAEKVADVDWKMKSGNSWKVVSGLPKNVPLQHLKVV